MLKHSKILLVAIVSAVVAIFTAIMGGITGGIIGSVVSSVLYNVLVEVFEEPVNKASSKKSFEWEVAYVFPLIVIAFIQVILIFAILARIDILPDKVSLVYFFIQDLTDYNLFRITGISLLIMSVYPFLLNAKVINKSHGILLFFTGLILLARGLSDLNFEFAYVIRMVYSSFNLLIAIFTLIILLYVINHILLNWFSHKSNQENIPTQKYDLRERDYYDINNNPKIVRKNKNKQFNEGSNNIRYDSSSHYKYRK